MALCCIFGETFNMFSMFNISLVLSTLLLNLENLFITSLALGMFRA